VDDVPDLTHEPSDLRATGRLLVDAMNLLGTRPDGWWRDRGGAVAGLVDRCALLGAALGVEVVLVVDGGPYQGVPEGSAAALGVTVRYARRRGRDAADDRIVELLTQPPDDAGEPRVDRPGGARSPGGAPPAVVTADRDLRGRVHAAGAVVVGPRRCWRLLDALAAPAGGDVEVAVADATRWRHVRALRLAALADTPDAFASTLEGERRLAADAWREQLVRDRAVTLVAELALTDGQVGNAGMAIVAPAFDRDDAGGMYGLWVAPWARGRGVGDALLRAALDHGRRLGFDRLVLDVGDHNAPAIALYERFGFVPTGRTSALPPPREHVTEHERLVELDAGTTTRLRDAAIATVRELGIAGTSARTVAARADRSQ
jgi:ribosomal protein S18 acetylase RimI-like enzyme